MSVIKKAREKIGKAISGDTSMSFTNQALQKAGLQMVSTERMTERKREQKTFNVLFEKKPDDKASPEQRFEFYVKQLGQIWSMYKENQMAWFRSGTNGIFGRMVTAIEVMKEETDVAIEANRNILQQYNQKIKELTENETDKTKKTAIEKRLTLKKDQLVRDFYIAYLVKLMFKYVRMQGNLCWLTEDVTIPASFPIMTNQPIQQDRAKVNEELLGDIDDVSK